MKKLIATLFCCCFITQYAFSADPVPAPAAPQSVAPATTQAAPRAAYTQAPAQGYAAQGYAAQGYADGQCPADCPCPDQRCNDCWCLYVHYKPCYYTTQRCVEEMVPCKKTCYRQVPKYYQVQRCRMVPEYYNETCCKMECECYEVDDCKCVTKTVCDQHCQYQPQYYWKHVCGDANCTTPCPQ